MKHIFTVHNHITFLTTLGVIQYHNLSVKEVIIINHHYQPTFDFEHSQCLRKSFDEEYYQLSLLKRMQLFHYPSAVREYISNISSGQEYVAYIDIMSVFNRYLVTYKRCKRFNLIEEGIYNYADFQNFDLMLSDLRTFDWEWTYPRDLFKAFNAFYRILRGRSLKVLSLPVSPNSYTGFKDVISYCFSPLAFKSASSDQKIVLSFKEIIKSIKFNSLIPDDVEFLWIGQTLWNYDHEDYGSAFESLLKTVNPTKKKLILYAKFRGSETEDEMRVIYQACEAHNFEIKELSQDTILELEFLEARPMRVLGFNSSLLIYAKLAGHNVDSGMKHLPGFHQSDYYHSYRSLTKLFDGTKV